MPRRYHHPRQSFCESRLNRWCCSSDGYLRRVPFMILVWLALMLVLYVLWIETGGQVFIPPSVLALVILVASGFAIALLIGFASKHANDASGDENNDRYVYLQLWKNR